MSSAKRIPQAVDPVAAGTGSAGAIAGAAAGRQCGRGAHGSDAATQPGRTRCLRPRHLQPGQRRRRLSRRPAASAPTLSSLKSTPAQRMDPRSRARSQTGLDSALPAGGLPPLAAMPASMQPTRPGAMPGAAIARGWVPVEQAEQTPAITLPARARRPPVRFEARRRW